MASEASGHELWQQLEEADLFLARHEAELRTISGIDKATLDFGYYCRISTGTEGKETVVHNEHIKPSLLKRCGELGIGISLSLYPSPDDNPNFTGNNSEQNAGA